ncbi:tetrahydrofolate dehydrogenase/cyclohydrolase catalytic domain-containing protein [Mycobacterium sp. ITM-2016-00317]|uniref:tetrahydrofolate dehydrogenase/cyclohydrolase catalytic domain-containing protein n=1 Tax=Mycobacterium sp. ITM-2016-00317 TaxID=2099694 RepID=UPI00287F430D|nr:tetrahydrofolate dehydrogenase/cyclohydrolase catalytic domain-containing protein [Mycobacterium sp. ITM-2016-00317]WNG88026.1 tetrahydrofolate dehydrogenase/cyclohydrolase catalytic domain-containing protein [Mycobacterium sp. ITM-2016-00317]
MSADVIDGIAVAHRILADTAVRATQFADITGRKPRLATVLVGDDPASHTYVRMKTNRCRTVGLDSQAHRLPEAAATADVVALVAQLATDNTVDGILVQHPMPPQIDERQVCEAIPPPRTSTA